MHSPWVLHGEWTRPPSPVRGGKHYLYRAVDPQGKSVDHLLCADRSRDAAQAFFRKAIRNATKWPRTINLDGNQASHLVLRMLGEEDPRWQRIMVRDRRYLNNIIEQDATNREPEKEPSSASTANAPELTTSSKERRLRRIPSGIRHIHPVRQARKLTEGGGLYLLVAPTGGRYWRYNYRFSGKQKTIALGAYPDVPLEKARARHQAARRLLAAGTDPSLRRRELRTHGAAELEIVEISTHRPP